MAQLVRTYLEHEGYRVDVADTGEEAIALAQRARPNLVLLDLMLPFRSGFEVCRTLRTQIDVPIIMVTARRAEADRLRGFAEGADDYVVKPFSPRELVARVRAVTRRAKQARLAERPMQLRAGDLEINRERFEVRMKGRAIELTRKEFDLLAIFVAAPGRVFGREELLDLVWGRDGFVEPRTVDVHLARMRAKCIAARVTAPPIETVRGVGYRFKDPGDRS